MFRSSQDVNIQDENYKFGACWGPFSLFRDGAFSPHPDNTKGARSYLVPI